MKKSKLFVVFVAFVSFYFWGGCGGDSDTSSNCTDECSSGAKRCSGQGYQACGNTDSDSCLEWGAVTACGTGQICGSGECLGCTGDEYINMGTYSIAKYEASHPGATASNPGTDISKACSLPGVLPWADVDWDKAKAACETVGGRLCSIAEWGDACSGGTTYPYGDTYDGSICNGQHAGFDETVTTGSMSGCVSDSGAYDMSGNLWEWTEESLGSNRVQRGGSFYDIGEGCLIGFPNNPAFEDTDYGFRCCRDV